MEECSKEKHGLDLNRDPVEQMESTLTITDLSSRQDLDLNESIKDVCENNDGGCENNDGGCENEPNKGIIGDVDSDKVKGSVGQVVEEEKVPDENRVEVVVKKRRGRKKKVVVSTKDETLCRLELERKDLSELSPSGERNCDKVIKFEDNVAADGNGEPRGKGDVAKGKGRRGRKKKEVKDSRKDDVSHDSVSLKEDWIDASTQVQVDKSNAKGENTSGRRGSERKRIKVDYAEYHDDDFTDEEQIDASGDECKIKPGKRRRGRKRKKAEGIECPDNDQVKRQKVNTALSLGPFKRVLRSQTVAVVDGEKHVHRVKDVGGSSKKIENKIDPSDKILKTRVNDNAVPKKRGRPKLKGRRGRPPKMQGRNEISSPMSSQKDKLRDPKRGTNYEKADGLVRGSKQLKANQTNAVEEVVNIKKEMASGYEEDTDQANAEANNDRPGDGRNKRLSSDPHHAKKSKLKGNKPEVMESGLREQKQAIRNQIIDMLVKAGWTIEYRQRATRKYADAIFYDPEGRQHWSVTLAYKRLKKKVESGEADDKTNSAFTPIAEEVFSTLFRCRKEKENNGKKKQKDDGSKMSKKMTKLKLSKKQSAKNKQENDHKGSVGSKTGVRRKKLRPNTEDGHRRKPALLARSSQGGVDSDGDEFILYDGKRTLLAWMIELGVIQSDSQVHYIYGGRKKVKHEGKIKGDGICCGCCGETLKLTDFESHAGSKLGTPFENVFLQSGQSLLQCLVDSWNKQKEMDRIAFHSVDIVGDDPNDDTCNICGDGGDLICCDSCPSTFHQSCLDIQKLPSGDWRCVYCSCKFCGTVVRNSSENDDRDGMLVSELLTCHLCEGKFHLPCVPGDGAKDFDSKDLSFCGKGCQKIFEGLHLLLGVTYNLDEGFCWRLLRHRDFGRDTNLTDDLVDIECNCKLAVAFSIMNECFVPIVDQRSKINVIQSVVYSCGSNFTRLNYNGFYTIVLEKGDELISAASIRIHGNQVAEMPFIGTRYVYRRQGMCRRLLTAIETALCSLGVEKLVIPAITELNETWTKVFGFKPLEKSKRQEMKYMSMLVFPGTDMLQKPLLKDQFSEGQVTSTGSNADAFSEVKLNQDDKGPILPVESSLDIGDGILNDTSDCQNSLPCHASEADAHETEKTANCSSAQHGMKIYQHCVSGMEGKPLISSPVAPISTIHEEKAIHSLEDSKEAASCLRKREVECLNNDSDSLDKGCQETSPVYWEDRNARHTLEVPAGKDSIASSEMTSDMICDSSGSIKAIPQASHQIEKVMGCSDLPVPNGYICDKTSTSGLSCLNSPLASQETSHEIMRSNINDHKEVSVGAHVLSLDSKSLQDVAQLSAKSTEELVSCSS
ncbi:uncharacterized protein LOC132610929 [Lycium barbarum]|uniref:uncharacterized protein LOC132610929 n=1 Tax=Lycium barbarum TaxID=112863 RepID=UPI00293E3105|nr:uncharacterized protein LOC132610929 [Lycium barbarum]XP_060181323.1 uncharacterized protein LOC132610929 [Lycium barbarum]